MDTNLLAFMCISVVLVGTFALIWSFRDQYPTVERHDILISDSDQRVYDLASKAIDAVNEARADSLATARLAMGYVNDARVDQDRFVSRHIAALNAGVRVAEVEGRLYRLEKERERLGEPLYVATALDSPRLPPAKRLTPEAASEFIHDQNRLLGDGVIEGKIVRWID